VQQCICKGDEDSLIKCDIKAEMINEYVDSNDTLLMKAVMECAPSMVRIILEKGANPNVRSKNGKTPLMIAVELVSFFDKSATCCLNWLKPIGLSFLLQTLNTINEIMMNYKINHIEIKDEPSFLCILFESL
jgi:Ankyrin repeat.